MLGPCCLCPLVDNKMPDFVESAIFQATSGRFAGEYVAACASEPGCGYLGEIHIFDITHLFTHGWIMKISPNGTTVQLPWVVHPCLP